MLGKTGVEVPDLASRLSLAPLATRLAMAETLSFTSLNLVMLSEWALSFFSSSSSSENRLLAVTGFLFRLLCSFSSALSCVVLGALFCGLGIRAVNAGLLWHFPASCGVLFSGAQFLFCVLCVLPAMLLAVLEVLLLLLLGMTALGLLPLVAAGLPPLLGWALGY